MAVEKQAESDEKDIRMLVKMADEAGRTVVYDMDDLLGKPAVAVIATGPRAWVLRKILEEMVGQ